MRAWAPQFDRHGCDVFVVRDDTEDADVMMWSADFGYGYEDHDFAGNAASILGEDIDLVPRKSPACRCIGFAAIAADGYDAIVTLDDDLTPDGDTIGDHLAALKLNVPTSWMSSTLHGSPYMRGFPYAVRGESPVWVSHGVWQNIPDLDAPTQLVLGEPPAVEFYRGPVPRGVYFPVCGMNLAFRPEALPLMYWCPAKRLPGAERFDDIWMGVNLTRGLAAVGAALVTGFASCIHTRASNVFANLEQEAKGIGLNETYWMGACDEYDFFRTYEEHGRRWAARMRGAT
jgi:hypothetical protein